MLIAMLKMYSVAIVGRPPPPGCDMATVHRGVVAKNQWQDPARYPAVFFFGAYNDHFSGVG